MLFGLVSMAAFLFFSIFLLLHSDVFVSSEIATVYKHGSEYVCELGKLDKQNGLAWATFHDTQNSVGWATLVVSTSHSESIPNEHKAHAAGYVEGCLTSSLISSHFVNMKSWLLSPYNRTLPEFLKTFFDEQWAWLKEQVGVVEDGQQKEGGGVDDLYWITTGIVMDQMEGLMEAYAVYGSLRLSFAEFQVMAAFGDLFDLKHLKEDEPERFTHCSALIALAPDLSDLFVGHNTWFHYPSMTRIFKEYHLHYCEEIGSSFSIDDTNPSLGPVSITFSSYPGTIVSQDDFYFVSASGNGGRGRDLYVQETTFEIYNMSLFDLLTPKTSPTWTRTFVANLLASTGLEWSLIFEKHNSGTYNCMWSIVDLSKFVPGRRPVEGLLHVLEQVPGMITHSDMTRILALGHWPSVNAPYSDEMYYRTGYDTLVQGTDDYNTWGSQVSVRSKIIRRGIGRASESFESFRSFLRECNYHREEFSGGDPGYVLAPRFDLRPEGVKGRPGGCWGNTDAKVSSWSHWMEGDRTIDIIAGPPHDVDGVPPFRWDTDACAGFEHVGMPKGDYVFTWMAYQSSLE